MINLNAIFLLTFWQVFGFSTANVRPIYSNIQDEEYSPKTNHSVFDNFSNNSIINVSNIVDLQIMEFKDLENITDIGDSIDCNALILVKFISCKNVTIKAVKWQRCGISTDPAISFADSSTMNIQDCLFQHSVGQLEVIALSEVSENVYINNCLFANNTE